MLYAVAQRNLGNDKKDKPSYSPPIFKAFNTCTYTCTYTCTCTCTCAPAKRYVHAIITHTCTRLRKDTRRFLGKKISELLNSPI